MSTLGAPEGPFQLDGPRQAMSNQHHPQDLTLCQPMLPTHTLPDLALLAMLQPDLAQCPWHRLLSRIER